MGWQDAPLIDDAPKPAPASEGAAWQRAEVVGAQPSNAAASDYALGTLGGFNEGLANMAGFPVDIVNYALDQIPGYEASETPVGGSAFFKGLMTDNMTYAGPDDPMGRILNRTGQELGATALPAGGMLAAARTGGPIAARHTRNLAQALLDPIRRSPGRATMGEVAAATGAGVGAGVAQEVAPDSVTAEIAAQLIGGAAPSMLAQTPTAMATRIGKAAVDRLSPQARTDALTREVRRSVGNEMTPEAEANLSQADRLRDEIPGFNPSLGEATGSPALIATQRDIEGRATGQDLESLVARRQGAEQAVDDYAAANAPQGQGGPSFVVDAATGRFTSMQDRTAAATADAAGRRQDVAGTLPQTDRAAAGATIRQQLIDERRATQDRMSALAEELQLTDVDVSDGFRASAQRFVDDFEARSLFEDQANAPAVLNDIRAAIQGNQPVTFGDLKVLRERVSDDLFDAMSAANPSNKKIRTLTAMRARVDDLIGELTQSADPELASRYQQFRQAYRDEYVSRFEDGAGFKVRQRDGRGFYRTRDEQVATAFFQPGNVQAARQFNRVFRGDPTAGAALEAVVLDDLRRAAVSDGVINSGRYRSWLDRHADVLAEFPELRRKVMDIQAADQSLLARQQQLAQRERAVENSLLSRVLRGYSRGTRTAQAVIDDAVKDPRKMGQLRNSLRNTPEALDALRRQVWERAASGSAEDTLNFIRQNNETLQQLFEPKHFDALANIAGARAMLERVPAPNGAGYRPRPLEDAERIIGQGIPQLSSRVFAYRSGRMQKGYLIVDSVMRGLRGRAQVTADDLYKAALYDPDVARDFSQALMDLKLPQEKARALRARVLALGVTPMQAEQERQEALPAR